MPLGFDAIAQDYQRRYGQEPAALALSERLQAEIEAALPPGARILDVGSGPGTHALPLARRGYRVVAVDTSAAMLAELERRARAEGLAIDLLHVDIRGLRLTEPAQAAVAVHGPLHYTPNPRAMVQAILQNLRPGAPLWIGAPRAASLRQLVERPGRALRPVWRSPRTHPTQVAGEPLAVHLWDPRAFARNLEPQLSLEHFEAIGLLPGALGARLGRWPGLRHLGHSSLLRFRARSPE